MHQQLKVSVSFTEHVFNTGTGASDSSISMFQLPSHAIIINKHLKWFFCRERIYEQIVDIDQWRKARTTSFYAACICHQVKYELQKYTLYSAFKKKTTAWLGLADTKTLHLLYAVSEYESGYCLINCFTSNLPSETSQNWHPICIITDFWPFKRPRWHSHGR